MTEQQSGFTPTDPTVEDAEVDRETEPQSESPAAETQDQAEPSPGPRRQFGRIGWTLVALVAVLGALMAVELVRISSALDRTACIQRAQANFMEAQGPGVTATFAGLDRLTGQNQLNKCGQ